MSTVPFRKLAFALLLCACFFPAPKTRAQGPPIHTDTPIMLGLEGRGVRTFFEVVRKSRLLEDGNEVDDPSGRSVTAQISPLAVPYNFTSTFQVGAVIPFVTKTLDSDTMSKTRSGVGDVSLFIKKLLAQIDRKGETFRVAVKRTAKLPTGDDETPVPLGTGAIDYGDRVGYNASVGFRLLPVIYERYPSPQLNLYVERNGSMDGRTEISGVRNADSGGSTLFFSPGIQFIGGRKWLIEASLQFPVRDEPNGTQLGTDWAASSGARILLF